MYSSIPTDLLLLMCEGLNVTIHSPLSTVPDRHEHARRQLALIDAELQQRRAEGEFRTLLGEDGQPVGFEVDTEIEDDTDSFDYYDGFAICDH